MAIQAPLLKCQEHISTLLNLYLPATDPSTTLYSAMRYACLNGGKRIRPLLAYQTAEIFDTPWETLDPIALAIELIHCYSLIHDDLPAMDDDDLRRGKPTCHKVFGEAIAILTGDGLLTLAFEILASEEDQNPKKQLINLQIMRTLAKAAGTQGMVQGQALDVMSEGKTFTLEKLITMHQRKTGALLAASVQCGALVTGQATKDNLADLHNFGQAIGLCFQIQDDILDALGNSRIMGKYPLQDVKNSKCTFVTLLGLEKARSYAIQYHQEALGYLTHFGRKADPLREIATYIVERVA